MIAFRFIFTFYLIRLTTSAWPKECTWPVIEDKCYMIHKLNYNFNQAVAHCQTLGGTLAVITKEATMISLTKAFRNETCFNDDLTRSRFWINAADYNSEGTFHFTNGTVINFQMFDYQPWYKGQYNQPDNKDRTDIGGINSNDADCVSVGPESGRWYDDYCTYTRHHICQFTHNDQCNIKDISISNSEFDFCFEDKTVPYGYNVTINCRKGYQLTGDINVTCLNQGKWSTFPTCTRGCIPPYPKAHSRFVSLERKEYYDHEEAVTYLCDEGYVYSLNLDRTHFDLICTGENEWYSKHASCVPKKPYEIQEIFLNKGQSVDLPCALHGDEENMIIDDLATYQWFKDSTDACPECEYDEDGTLPIKDFSEEKIGSYLCFYKREEIERASKVYNLQLKQHCPDNNVDGDEYIVAVGESIRLPCPSIDSYSSFQWYRNSKPIHEDSRHIVYDDASLQLMNVEFAQSGRYTCQRKQDGGFCTTNSTVDVRMTAQAWKECGKSQDGNYHPWIVSLWQKEDSAPFCYGTLINQYWIITSGQCLTDFYRKRKLELYALFNMDATDAKPFQIAIAKIEIHPTFARQLYINDIGLLKLVKPVRFSDTVRPICWNDTDFTKKTVCNTQEPIHGIVSGFGPLELNRSILLSEQLTLVNSELCYEMENVYGYNMMCFETKEDEEATHAGDTGSPIVVKRDGRYHLLGIFSKGERALRVGNYDYFTKIANHASWIKNFVDAV